MRRYIFEDSRLHFEEFESSQAQRDTSIAGTDLGGDVDRNRAPNCQRSKRGRHRPVKGPAGIVRGCRHDWRVSLRGLQLLLLLLVLRWRQELMRLLGGHKAIQLVIVFFGIEVIDA